MSDYFNDYDFDEFQNSIEILENEYPNAECSLDFMTPLQLLIAVILSAQSTDAQINKLTPALFQKFKTAKDFEKNIGNEVEVKLYAPIKGQKYFEGVLKEYDGKNIVISVNNEDIKIELTRISKINEAIKFD